MLWIQTLTLIWMAVEAVASLGAAWMARSPALLAFGGDSAIELLSAGVVFQRFYKRGLLGRRQSLPSRDSGIKRESKSPPFIPREQRDGAEMPRPGRGKRHPQGWGTLAAFRQEHAEKRAGRIAGSLLFMLAIFVTTTSVLTFLGRVEARPSPVGIALLALAAIIMPWLAAQKWQLSIRTGSAALRADAAESAVCGYLALIALAGLAVNAVWKVSWADPVAALALLPLILREGWEAWKGRPCAE